MFSSCVSFDFGGSLWLTALLVDPTSLRSPIRFFDLDHEVLGQIGVAPLSALHLSDVPSTVRARRCGRDAAGAAQSGGFGEWVAS